MRHRRRRRPSRTDDDHPVPPPHGAPTPLPPAPHVAPAAPLAVAPELVTIGGRRRLYRAAMVSGALVIAPSAATIHHAQEAPPPPRAVLQPADLTTASATLGPLVEPVGRPRPVEAASPSPLARVGDVELTTPARQPIVVGFHEAAGATTEVLTPLAAIEDDHNPGQVVEAADAVPTEEETVVLPSRERGTHAASAVDIAVATDEPILAPVSGEVLSVSPYVLYGQHADWRIEIAASEDPSVRVIVVHVTDPVVEPGDGVVAGASVIAEQPTQFPFVSQIDRLTMARVGHATPHVHVEVKRA